MISIKISNFKELHRNEQFNNMFNNFLACYTKSIAYLYAKPIEAIQQFIDIINSKTIENLIILDCDDEDEDDTYSYCGRMFGKRIDGYYIGSNIINSTTASYFIRQKYALDSVNLNDLLGRIV